MTGELILENACQILSILEWLLWEFWTMCSTRTCLAQSLSILLVVTVGHPASRGAGDSRHAYWTAVL